VEEPGYPVYPTIAEHWNVEKSEVDQESVNQKRWMKKKHDDALTLWLPCNPMGHPSHCSLVCNVNPLGPNGKSD